MAIKLLYIDLFCGAGGTSTGVERARINGSKCAKVIACVNHDANAILSHAANHPHTRHFTEDIRTLDLGPMKVHIARERMKHPGAKLVLWASLECTNHSRAKGGMSRDADSRTLADHLFRYIEELHPDYIQIENVVEFMEWGPLIVKESVGPDGAAFCPLDIKHDRRRRTTSVAPVWVPDPEHKGILYCRWVEEVCAHGYRFEHRVLNAADFGAYTSRVRYFGQFVRPDLPMAWPRPTHTRNPEQTRDLFTEPLAPWRPVRECLDFEDRGESIFNRRRQLVGATLDRIHAGLVKFVAGGKDAFLVKYNSRNQSGQIHRTRARRAVPDRGDTKPARHSPCGFPIQAVQRTARGQEHSRRRPGRNRYDNRPPRLRIGILRKRIQLTRRTAGPYADNKRPIPVGAAIYHQLLFRRRANILRERTMRNIDDNTETTIHKRPLPAEPAIPIRRRLCGCALFHADRPDG